MKKGPTFPPVYIKYFREGSSCTASSRSENDTSRSSSSPKMKNCCSAVFGCCLIASSSDCDRTCVQNDLTASVGIPVQEWPGCAFELYDVGLAWLIPAQMTPAAVVLTGKSFVINPMLFLHCFAQCLR